MSPEAERIIQFILSEMSSMKYGYRSNIEGCFDMAIHCGLKLPIESKDLVVDEALYALLNI